MGRDDVMSQAIVLPSSTNYQPNTYDRQAASYQSPYSRMANAYGSTDVSFSEHTLLAQPQQQQALIENTVDTDNALQEVLKNSRFSTCTDVQTLDSTPSLITDENGLASNGFIHSILTRRLGLIVGCCLGIIVFIVMISVLSYVKLKKQRIENAKRQATMPPDYMSYRHFSIPNEELLRSGAVMSSVPSGISAHISGTSLSTSGTTTATATTPLGILKVTESMGGVGVTTTGGSSITVMMAGGNGTTNLTSSTAIATSNDVVSVATTTASNHNHHMHHHHHHHNHHQQQQQQHQQQQLQQHSHQGNGNVVGYMAAGLVLGANHLNNVAC